MPSVTRGPAAPKLPAGKGACALCLPFGVWSVLLPAFFSLSSAVDGFAADATVTWQTLINTERGAHVKLHLDDGSVMDGAYQGIELRIDEAYGGRYERWRASHPNSKAPRLGSAVTVQRTAGAPESGPLLGFGPGYLRFSSDTAQSVVSYTMLAVLQDSTGNRLTSADLARLEVLESMPLFLSSRVRTRSGEHLVPLDQITATEVFESGRTGIVIIGGFLIGVAAAFVLRGIQLSR